MTSEEPKNLSLSSQNCLAFVKQKLRGGFTGRLELDCVDGGIRMVLIHEAVKPRDIPGPNPV